MYSLGLRSRNKLVGVNPLLAFAVQEAIEITEQDFMVFEGVRSKARQAYLLRQGRTKTMKSNHLTGNAVDLVVYSNGKPQWDNVEEGYKLIQEAMKTIIKRHDLPIEHGYELWGWDWPHWQVKKPDRDKWHYTA